MRSEQWRVVSDEPVSNRAVGAGIVTEVVARARQNSLGRGQREVEGAWVSLFWAGSRMLRPLGAAIVPRLTLTQLQIYNYSYNC